MLSKRSCLSLYIFEEKRHRRQSDARADKLRIAPFLKMIVNLESLLPVHNMVSLGMGMIATGAADAVICGGVEFMSDVPIRFSRKMRGLMMSMPKAKTTKKKLSTVAQVVIGQSSWFII